MSSSCACEAQRECCQAAAEMQSIESIRCYDRSNQSQVMGGQTLPSHLERNDAAQRDFLFFISTQLVEKK